MIEEFEFHCVTLSMARPRKDSADKRNWKIIVWVTAGEQARYLLNAVRAGLTGPDFLRAVACGSIPESSDAKRELVLPLSPSVHAALLRLAGTEGTTPDQIAARAITAFVTETSPTPVAQSFELVDGLSHIGVSLQRLVPIVEQTGYVPDELVHVLDRLDSLLDRVLPA